MQKKTSPQILCQKIADIIRQKITIGELPPGERLSEATLSEQLEISRNTLREVFRILTQEGLLTYKPINLIVVCLFLYQIWHQLWIFIA